MRTNEVDLLPSVEDRENGKKVAGLESEEPDPSRDVNVSEKESETLGRDSWSGNNSNVIERRVIPARKNLVRVLVKEGIKQSGMELIAKILSNSLNLNSDVKSQMHTKNHGLVNQGKDSTRKKEISSISVSKCERGKSGRRRGGQTVDGNEIKVTSTKLRRRRIGWLN
ncbi:hypothetical protein Ddye_027192 [Dipteronia dyeriana]|uniref:Uncharacterized protein n=1 Tax=Dipteronia dyeriana TaxID=168575 RepID=A0AAD9TNL9_9ROSI|nr:hypothetical protein Ddye_027192 [Dipteronia dyeriana]